MKIIYSNEPESMRFEEVKVGDTFNYNDLPFMKVMVIDDNDMEEYYGLLLQMVNFVSSILLKLSFL